MNIYKVSCHSSCGSYFASYLQSVTVFAVDEKEAIKIAKEWLKKEGRKFLYEEDKWRVDLVTKKECGVIDYHSDSDY